MKKLLLIVTLLVCLLPIKADAKTKKITVYNFMRINDYKSGRLANNPDYWDDYDFYWSDFVASGKIKGKTIKKKNGFKLYPIKVNALVINIRVRKNEKIVIDANNQSSLIKWNSKVSHSCRFHDNKKVKCTYDKYWHQRCYTFKATKSCKYVLIQDGECYFFNIKVVKNNFTYKYGYDIYDTSCIETIH